MSAECSASPFSKINMCKTTFLPIILLWFGVFALKYGFLQLHTNNYWGSVFLNLNPRNTQAVNSREFSSLMLYGYLTFSNAPVEMHRGSLLFCGSSSMSERLFSLEFCLNAPEIDSKGWLHPGRVPSLSWRTILYVKGETVAERNVHLNNQQEARNQITLETRFFLKKPTQTNKITEMQ